ncbi:glycosyltransferase [Epilithonimonas sp.]|uniref:glycosyltransferase n=1 Tax=Epilithonimonas sp. TaxID=2894511 RepID=UPI0028AE9DCB|nr:glycosyltransferase [Epilithonimonas sp.]
MNISFIIPVYNVEKYVAKAVDSVINNNWGQYTFEIVVVDDESPDNSIDIVRHIQNQNPKADIKIFSQKNKGLGGARNTGISNASGDYIFFLDSDDYILQNIFVDLLNKTYQNNLDVLEFAAKRVDEVGRVTDEVFHISTEHRVLTGEDYVREVNFANSACNKLYRREFLLSESITFIERVFIEDAPFNVEVFLKAKRVEADDVVAVAYLQNLNSITRSKRSGDYLEKFINDSITITARINHLSNLYQQKESRNKIRSKVAFFLAGILRMILLSNNFNKVQKKNAFRMLKSNSLFPYYQKTNSIVRTLFLYSVNILSSLRII